MSFDRLCEKILALRNPSVAGLDPRLEFIPAHILAEAQQRCADPLEAAGEALYLWGSALIDALHDIVPAVKPQCAYYELYGWPGVRALTRLIAYAKARGMFVITDGKRNDIGSTMEAYAAAHLGTSAVFGQAVAAFDADALTVNGYLGTDGIQPLLGVCRQQGKGIFVLVKTSNPSSGELQDRALAEGGTIYRAMGALCEHWGEDTCGQFGYSAVGAVVGATYPQQLAELRGALPHTFFLVPGYGAQGGTARDIAGAFDSRGLGAIVNSSRAIMRAYEKEGCDPRDFAGAARREALRMRDELREAAGL